jgi:phosphoribosylglycinamide formyltransferase 1
VHSGQPAGPSALLLLPDSKPPLRVAALVSGAGRNLKFLLELQQERPDLVDVVAVATENPWVPALDVAREAGLPTMAGHFEERCGRWSQCVTEQQKARYRQRAREFHDNLTAELIRFEQRNGRIDLVVLAYARWIHGDFLMQFNRRIINQHPGDLTELGDDGQRLFAGPFPIEYALRAGRTRTRTSTFLVDESHDGGAILCQGPWLDWPQQKPYSRTDGDKHECQQAWLSDRPTLRWTVAALAAGRLVLDLDRRARDGSALVSVDEVPLPLGGFQIDKWKEADHA